MADDLVKELLREVAANPEKTSALELEQTKDIRRHINPLGNVVSAKKSYAIMSVVNWKDTYLRRLHLSAMTGYLYRVLDEYEPEEELAAENARYAAALKAPGASKNAAQLAEEHRERVDLITKTARRIVGKFLDRHLNFNPDKHAREAHCKSDSADSERAAALARVKAAAENAPAAKVLDAKLQARGEITYKYSRERILAAATYSGELLKIANSLAECAVAAGDDDLVGIVLKKYTQLRDLHDELQKIAGPLASLDCAAAWEKNPPADVFYHIDRYLTNHYEQLRDVVEAMYAEKPDLEFAVILQDVCKSMDDAQQFLRQHEAEFRTGTFVAETGHVCMLGPFKENRERVEFYSKNTEVMKRMMDQVEADTKLARDIVNKQVRTKKRKNIEEAGPDAPALAAYAKTMNTVQELGAKKVLTREEQRELEDNIKKAKDIKEDYEVPDDAIQVDVFFPQTAADGTQTLAKSKFYTQAEAPLHLEENSPYAGTYQPPRPDNIAADEAGSH